MPAMLDRVGIIGCALISLTGAGGAAADQMRERLVEQADAIALVEILSTDTSAMPADGPMKAQARVVKVVKGYLSEGNAVRFDASAWMGPTYRPGERRIVFLKWFEAEGMAGWASVEVGWLDLFFTDAALASCSKKSLTAFLRALDRQPPRPRLQVQAGPLDERTHLLVPDNDRRCRQDADCVLLSTHCGDCTCGTAINRDWEAHYQEAGRARCEGYQGPVCDMYCPQQVPRCVGSRCELGS